MFLCHRLGNEIAGIRVILTDLNIEVEFAPKIYTDTHSAVTGSDKKKEKIYVGIEIEPLNNANSCQILLAK